MSGLLESQSTLGARSIERLPVSVPAAGMAEATSVSARAAWRARALPYVSIARPDHWFKNVFMALGVLLAYLYHPELFGAYALVQIAWALAATCLVASSNYVLNEILDAPTDRHHPVKRLRPIPSGQVKIR